MYLFTDFINPQGLISIVSTLDKIQRNIELIPILKESINKQKQTSKKAFSSLTVSGRWLVVYQANVHDDDDTMMHFIDFRMDLDFYKNEELFSQNTLNNLITLQSRYDSIFSQKMDTVELTLAEIYEKVIKDNLFACDNDDIVFAKAKDLGALPMIENLHGNEKVRVAIVDEKQEVDDSIITNVYAIIHFDGHGEGREKDNGFVYIKIYDLLNNFNLVQDFQDAVENAGGKFDRAFFMERFDKYKMN